MNETTNVTINKTSSFICFPGNHLFNKMYNLSLSLLNRILISIAIVAINAAAKAFNKNALNNVVARKFLVIGNMTNYLHTLFYYYEVV